MGSNASSQKMSPMFEKALKMAFNISFTPIKIQGTKATKHGFYHEMDTFGPRSILNHCRIFRQTALALHAQPKVKVYIVPIAAVNNPISKQPSISYYLQVPIYPIISIMPSVMWMQQPHTLLSLPPFLPILALLPQMGSNASLPKMLPTLTW